MELSNRHVVVTGGGGGIGRALVRRVVAEGARAVVVADRDISPGRSVAEQVGGFAVELSGSRSNTQTPECGSHASALRASARRCSTWRWRIRPAPLR